MIKYQALEMIENDNDALQWWAVNHETFPNLALLVKKYLSALPSSVASERLFSIGGIIHMPKRNRIGPGTGEMLMLLHHNLPMLGFDYSRLSLGSTAFLNLSGMLFCAFLSSFCFRCLLFSYVF